MNAKTRVVYRSYQSKPIYYVDGAEATEAKYRAATVDRFVVGEIPSCPHSAGWPIHSDAAGVHPDDIPAAMAAARERGVPTDFDKEGRPILTGPLHRREYCEKVRGFFDGSAGYHDPTPTGQRYQVGSIDQGGGAPSRTN